MEIQPEDKTHNERSAEKGAGLHKVYMRTLVSVALMYADQGPVTATETEQNSIEQNIFAIWVKPCKLASLKLLLAFPSTQLRNFMITSFSA